MTRETKLGLVVSCSFVCLLGTVLFIKLNEGASVPPSPYAKADGSAPDLPEEPVPIQMTVAPTAPASESPAAPAAPGNNSGENRSTPPVMALPAPTFDPNVMRAEATTGSQAGADKNTNTAPAPLPVPAALPAAPAPSPGPTPRNDFSALVPPMPSAPAPASTTPAAPVKDETPKTTPSIDGVPKKEREASPKDATPAVPPVPPPDNSPQPDAKPQARDAKPVPGSDSNDKFAGKEDKHSPRSDSQGQDQERNPEKKDKKLVGTPVTPLPGLEDKSKDSSPSVPLPTPDLQASAPAGLPDRHDAPSPAPASRQGERGLGTAPVETPLPETNTTPKESTPATPHSGTPRTSEGNGLPVPGQGLLTPPPKPPSASATPSAVMPIPSPSPDLVPGTSTSIGSTARPETPAPAPRDPIPAIAAPAPSGLGAGTTNSIPAPIPGTPGTGRTSRDPLPPTPDAVPRANTPRSPATATSDPNVPPGKPMSPVVIPANQYAQAPSRASDSLPAGSHPVPPVGAPVAGTSPPIAVPMPPGSASLVASRTPQVESYDEETYVCRANDTFEAISARVYSSKDYAQALMLFNRNHPRATAALQKDSPVLAEGQALYIPPIRILEKQYASAIPGYKPAPAAPAPAPDVTRTTARSLPSSPSPQYRVQKANEMIPIIARDTLGSVDRWTEIYQLNKGHINPAYPLPVGTVLAMPADAKVPPENRP